MEGDVAPALCFPLATPFSGMWKVRYTCADKLYLILQIFLPAIDHCHEHPCKNGGFCISEGDDFKCKCLDGYRGLLCEGE